MESLLNLDYDCLHSQIIYDSPQPLWKLAVVKSAVSLYYAEADDLWETNQMTFQVDKKIEILLIPETLRSKIALMSHLIWTQLYDFERALDIKFLTTAGWPILKNNLYWSSQGTIDKWKTAVALTDDDKLDESARFQIALAFCITDKMNSLYKKVPRNCFKNNDSVLEKMSGMDDIPKIKKHFRIPEAHGNYEDSFMKMAQSKNEIACHYYWQRLSEHEKINLEIPDYIHIMFFIFTHSDTERKLQLLQDKRNCYLLLKELLDYQWIFVFDFCIKAGLKVLSVNFVVKLLNDIAPYAWVKYSNAYTKKRIEICVVILQHFLKEYSVNLLDDDLTNSLLRDLHSLVEVGETRIVKILLESLDHKWIQKQFSKRDNSLKYLVLASIECGMMELIFSCAFPTVEVKNEFVSKWEFNYVTCQLFTKNQIDNANKLLSLLFSNSEDIESYKIKFVEDEGFLLCFRLLRNQKWEFANNFLHWCFSSKDEIASYKVEFATKDYGYEICFLLLQEKNWELVEKFVHWCFVTEEEITCFYNKFFTSIQFSFLFYPTEMDSNGTLESPIVTNFLEESTEAIRSLIKLVCLTRQLNINEIIPDICQLIISKHYLDYFCSLNLNKAEVLFDAMDRFLLSFFNDDQTMLIDFKKKIFTDKARKLYISLPLAFLLKLQKMQDEYLSYLGRRKWRLCDEPILWVQMIDLFFTWICSSNKRVKGKLERKFWNEEEIVKAKKTLSCKRNFEFPGTQPSKRRRV